jgi:hypothetical protein
MHHLFEFLVKSRIEKYSNDRITVDLQQEKNSVPNINVLNRSSLD